jgi:hypothetical protein
MSEDHLQGVWAVFRSDAKVIHTPQLTVHETCVEMLAAISTRKGHTNKTKRYLGVFVLCLNGTTHQSYGLSFKK